MSYKHSSVDASRRELDLLLNQDYLNAFKRPSYFSDTSTAHVFDVTDGLSSLRCNMQTDELTRLVMVSHGPSTVYIHTWLFLGFGSRRLFTFLSLYLAHSRFV